MNSQPNCYTISARKPFISELAGLILERYGETMPRLLVLLPNRRACRNLREAFLEVNSGKPILLPRIQPIGDLGESDSALFADVDAANKIPPAISHTRRQLLLTSLVMKFERVEAGRIYNVEQAAELARQLASFLDEMAAQNIDFSGLEKLVPEEFSAHWQQTINFLGIISKHWPKILDGEGVIDPVERRNKILNAVAKTWLKNPPPYPVIAAGSTGSQPATAALLNAIAYMPQGMVILPALDKEISDAEWDLLGATHPQYGLKQLIKNIGAEREKIGELAKSSENSQRESMLRIIFQSPEITSSWSNVSLPDKSTENLKIIVADTELDEARAIAIAMREILETPGKTASLVTPDRKLARMVAAQLQRFDISIDDSAGKPLLDTPPGCLMRLAVDMVASRAAPAELLALLRHPLTSLGIEPAECRSLSRLLEKELLRGIRHTPGLKALHDAAHNAQLKKLLAVLIDKSAELVSLYRGYSASTQDLLKAHVKFAEALSETEAGEIRLWSGEAGNSLAKIISELVENSDIISEIDPISYSGLFSALLSREVYRPNYGLHPRLSILSPIEARLLNFDLVILGGLNEGTWPGLPEASPWMSRPMKEKFGLPASERAIGQSAHDFISFASSSHVIMTRSRKVDGSPTVPSRWLVRMETLISGRSPHIWQSMQSGLQYSRMAALLDKPVDMEQLQIPKPTPPVSARPNKLSVTEIDTYLRDPYMIYAKHVLGLRALNPLDQDPDAADFGRIVHSALEQFAVRFPKIIPADAFSALIECGKAAFAEFMDRPAVAALWWPRFEALAEWFINQETGRRKTIQTTFAELKGEWEINIDGGIFRLTTRIDRLDYFKDSSLAIIDYKTGGLPSNSEIEKGLANQLALEALIVKNGRLTPAQENISGDITLEYWKLTGNTEQCEIKIVKTDLLQTKMRLEQLVRRFANPSEPYAAQINSALLPRYNDYAHLTRRQEWEGV